MIRGLDNPLELLFSIPVLLLAITFHEFAHGYMADKLGDPTPRSYGRLSLNPIKHLDPLGAIALLTVGFGWAKPVPFNPAYFKNYKKDTALVGLAGPVSNLILAFTALLVAKVLYLPTVGLSGLSADIMNIILIYMLRYNIGLAIFNLIPIPPLDGSKVFISILPSKWYYNILRYESYGQVILLLLLFTGMLNPVLNILFRIVQELLLAIVNILPF
ncbi:site-2 protease family protein [Petroclostridium sp. X23]|uniref:site-2 protease family protein n=1 Tax=Petroclostridium sp. X23 TaxID=3045146 RepID=UPI0024AD8973|nr:site-2 protease family protein [Petroclostridium sp. X23]WHH59440.1 site-2 protease family protein [Petroclostridium sp. X23]